MKSFFQLREAALVEGEGIVTPRRKVVGEPEPGSYAYERKYGKYTAKGELRKKPNTNKPPVKEENELEETKSAPKGFHFTKDGKLKRGDADVDGPGGPKLRSDPLDKTRSKVPPVSEAKGPAPGFMLKADPALAKKVKEKQDLHKVRAKAMGNPAAGKSIKEEVDDEGAMAKGQLMQMVSQASMLARMMDDNKQLDGWVQSKLTMAADYLDSVHDYLMHNQQDVDSVEEEVNPDRKTTHENPLVTVHNKHNGKWELHTHANLSVANRIFQTNVKHSDVHKGPVEVKSGGSYGNVKFAISKHHASEMKEEATPIKDKLPKKPAGEYERKVTKYLTKKYGK